MKTLFILSLILAANVFAQIKYSYVGGSGNWQTPSKWSPAGVPGIADTVVINSGILTNDSTVFVASLFQNGGTINGSGEINILDSLSISSGIQSGSGITKLTLSAIGVISGSTLSRALTNDGYLIWQASNVVFSGCVFTNNGTFDANSESSSFGFGGGGSIINNGIIIRSTATGTATFSVPLSNNGNINVKIGILQSSRDVTGSGSFIIDPGAIYALSSGAHTLGGNTISGGGTFEMRTTQSLNIISGNVTVLSGTTFLQSSGTITGDGDLVIEGMFDFTNGVQSGNGTTIIAFEGNCLAGGTQGKQFSRNLLNDGTFTWSGGNITFGASKTFTNNGTFNAETESGSLNNLGGVTIINNGVINRSVGTANVTIAPKFINNNELNILNGSISFNDSLLNNINGKIRGVGTLTMPSFNRLLNKGTVEPGNDVGILQFSGYYSQTPDASLKIEIGGFTVGTDRDSISVSGAAALNGELNIEFINNFNPQDGDVFPIMSFTSRTGEFAQVNFSNNVIGYVQYNSNGAQVVIGEPSSVKGEFNNNIPDTYQLAQNFPNPFNPTTKISWQSPIGSHQTLKIYDVLGNEVATLVDEFRNAGSYEVTFDASRLSSGIYLYKLQAGPFVETKKMTLLR